MHDDPPGLPRRATLLLGAGMLATGAAALRPRPSKPPAAKAQAEAGAGLDAPKLASRA